MDVIVYLNARCKEILALLMSANTHMTIDEIAKAKTVSRRSIYYDLCKINEWLEYHKVPQIEVERGKGIYLTPEQNRLLAQLTEQPDEAAGYVFSPGERVRAMIFLIIETFKTRKQQNRQTWFSPGSGGLISSFYDGSVPAIHLILFPFYRKLIDIHCTIFFTMNQGRDNMISMFPCKV